MKMIDPIRIQTYEAPLWNRREILRYAGVSENAAEGVLPERYLAEMEKGLTYRVCFREFPVRAVGEELDLGFMRTSSRHLAKALCGCERIVVFAATVGLWPDRLIGRYGTLSPSKALWIQAMGAERIESLCEALITSLREEKRKEGLGLRPRFSAGYGDFPLEAQREIFAALDCPRSIGLTLNESLLMSPTKSVTAIVGLTKADDQAPEGPPCGECSKQDCTYRRDQ